MGSLDLSGDTDSRIDEGKTLTVPTLSCTGNATVSGDLEVTGSAFFSQSTSMNFVGCSTATVTSTNSTSGSFGFSFSGSDGRVWVHSDTGGFYSMDFVDHSS